MITIQMIKKNDEFHVPDGHSHPHLRSIIFVIETSYTFPGSITRSRIQFHMGWGYGVIRSITKKLHFGDHLECQLIACTSPTAETVACAIAPETPP